MPIDPHNHQHDSDSDSDDDDQDAKHHRENKLGAHNGHFHDEHSRVHHEHAQITLNNESKQINLFHHDPRGGQDPYHKHFVKDEKTGRIYEAYHYGSPEHHKVRRGDPYYWLNNLEKYPVILGSGHTPAPMTTIPLPPPVLKIADEGYHPLEEDHKLNPPPYAPSYPNHSPGSPTSSAAYRHFGNNSSTLYQPKSRSSADSTKNQTEDECCVRSCIIL